MPRFKVKQASHFVMRQSMLHFINKGTVSAIVLILLFLCDNILKKPTFRCNLLQSIVVL